MYWKFLFPTKWKRCLDQESNPEILTCKVDALSLSYLGRQPSAFSHSENLLGRHIWSIKRIAQKRSAEGNGNTIKQCEKGCGY